MPMHGEASHVFRGNQYTVRLYPAEELKKVAAFANAERDSACSRTEALAAKRPPALTAQLIFPPWADASGRRKSGFLALSAGV